MKEMGFPKLLAAYFLCQLLVPFPYTLMFCLGLGLFLCSDLNKTKQKPHICETLRNTMKL